MSDDFVIDISAYEGLDSSPIEDVESGDAPESSLGKMWFGKWRYFHIKVDFAAGSPGFPIPGVYLDVRDGENYRREPGCYMVKGMLPNANSKNFVDLLVIERVSQSGKAYHTVLKYTGFDKLRKEYQYPALKPHIEKLQATGRRVFELARTGKNFDQINNDAGTWLYGSGKYTESKLTRKNQNDEEVPQKYIADLVFYASEAEMKKVEAEFWSELKGNQASNGNGASISVDLTKFPANWAKSLSSGSYSVDKFYTLLKENYEKYGKDKNVALIKTMVHEEDGSPKPNQDGIPCDSDWIFSQAIGVPF